MFALFTASVCACFKPAETWDEIIRLDITKKTSGGVLSHFRKLTSDIFFCAVTKLANDMVQQCTFPDELNLTDVSSVFKSGNTLLKKTIFQLVSFHHYQKSLSAYC